ncbi:Cadherin-like, partial [Desulfomicrobium apsheronum]
MYTINVGVRQGNGDFQEVRIDNGGRLNLANGDRLVLAAAPEDVEIVSGDRGDYVVRLKGGEEFFVASADDGKELVLISPDTGEPLIMFDIQHPEQEVDAHVSQPLGIHQASVAGTEFLQEDVGEDLGMGQLLDMASFSAESGEELTSASGPSFPDWEEPAGILPGDDGTGDSNSAPSVSGSVNLGSIDEDGSLVFARADLLATASDADGDALTVTGLSVASGDGTLTDNGDGTWTFAPSADWNGAVIFNYTVSDGNGGTIDTSANLTVNPVNDAPGIDVNAPINVEAEATVSLAGYLHAGDVDNAASELAYTITHAPEFGTLMLDGVAITDFSGTVFTQA